jgi:hypothetical protein
VGPRLNLDVLLRSLAKLAAVVVVGAAIGAGAGIGTSALTEDGSTASSPPARRAASATRTAPSAGSRPAVPVSVRVVSAVLHPAATSSGRRRRRGRLSVHVRVTNGSFSVVPAARPALMASAAVVTGKAVAASRGSLRGPLRPGQTAQGRIRFETAGAVTNEIATARSVRLRVAGAIVVAAVKVGSPVRPQAA